MASDVSWDHKSPTFLFISLPNLLVLSTVFDHRCTACLWAFKSCCSLSQKCLFSHTCPSKPFSSSKAQMKCCFFLEVFSGHAVQEGSLSLSNFHDTHDLSLIGSCFIDLLFLPVFYLLSWIINPLTARIFVLFIYLLTIASSTRPRT